MSVMQHPRYRSVGPLEEVPLSGFLSLNILFKEAPRRLCKTNCREIEVTILYPSPSPSSRYLEESEGLEGVEDFEMQGMEESSAETLECFPAAMSADQEHPELSPISRISSREMDMDESQEPFPFMSLPLELRFKIYAYLLPPRTHTIVTQLPHNGFFYNTSTIPAFSAQSFYPFGTKAPNNLTTYKVLSSNFRSSFPEPSIYPEILRVSRQVKDEAEPILYAGKDVAWDFGIHLEALKGFWGDRSESARRVVRNVRIAREIPSLENGSGELPKAVDARWVAFCSFLKTELTGLRTLDLTIWSSSGSTASFPVAAAESISPVLGDWEMDMDEERKRKAREEEVKKWREWKWTADLLQMDALRQARITWWGWDIFGGREGHGDGERTVRTFDSWLAGRMVGDRVVRERMVREGVVEEGVIVLSGLGV